MERIPGSKRNINNLQAGENIEITLSDGSVHRGNVDEVADDLHVVWLLEHTIKHRRLFHRDDIKSWDTPATPQTGLHA